MRQSEKIFQILKQFEFDPSFKVGKTKEYSYRKNPFYTSAKKNLVIIYRRYLQAMIKFYTRVHLS